VFSLHETLIYAVYGAVIAFGLGVVLCFLLIPRLTRLKFGQSIRTDGPKEHAKKAGTPTMGGIAIIISFAATVTVLVMICNAEGCVSAPSLDITAVILTTAAFGVIGFVDDFIKVVNKRSLGLRVWQKFACQFLVAGFFAYYVINSPTHYTIDYFNLSPTGVLFPFVKNGLELGVLYVPFIIFIIVGGVNAVNLTDGLDGLCSGVTVLIAVFFVYAAFMADNQVILPAGAMVGCLLAFLVFNSHPAKVFMGDTGSLALGGFVTSMAIILRLPVFLALAGCIYVAEALSVIIQVSYFKLTGGKRIFKMAPLHHHFELLGYKETKVTAAFCIVTAIMVMVGVLGLNV